MRFTGSDPFNIVEVDFETKHFMSFDPLLDYSVTQDCRALFAPIPNIVDHDHWIFGQSFLSIYFSIFDLDKNRIGLLNLADGLVKINEQDLEATTDDVIEDP